MNNQHDTRRFCQITCNIVIIFLIVVLFHSTTAVALGDNAEEPIDYILKAKKSKYERDPAAFGPHCGREIVVKFAEDTGLAFADELFENNLPFESITGSTDLDALKKKYHVVSVKRVFKKPTDIFLRPDLLKRPNRTDAVNKEKALNAAFSNHARQVQQRYARRHQRMPKQSQMPHLSNIYQLTFEEGVDIETVCRELSELPEVEYAVENQIHELHYVPDDPFYSSRGSWRQSHDDLYGLKSDKLDCEPAWDISLGQLTVVAVIDTGIDDSHPDLAANIWQNLGEIPDNGIDDDGNGYIDDIRGYDFSDDDADPEDYTGHGTHCAGTIAAVGGNAQGLIGVAPQTKIMCLKAFPNATDSVLSEAIRYAADNGADVISNSWGPGGVRPSSPVIEAAVDYAYSLGCIVVFSAGNDNDDVANYSPANYPKAIAVAATDHLDKKASNSNYGLLVDVSAPGVDILSLRAAGTDMYEGISGYTPGERFVPAYDPLAQYYRASATSMSVPHVAGLAALLINAYPDDSNASITGRIISSTDSIESNNPNYPEQLGTGRINAYRALTISETPYIKLADYSFSTAIAPGATSDLIVSMANRWALAEQVDVTLSSTDPYVTILQATSQYGDIDINDEKDNAAAPFVISVAGTAPYGHTFEFSLRVNAIGYQKIFSIVVANDSDMQISRLITRAGRRPSTDNIQFSGLLDATEAVLDSASEIVIDLQSEYMDTMSFVFPMNANSYKRGRYNYNVRRDDKSQESFRFDPKTGRMRFMARNTSLAGLSCPMTITITIGDYSAQTVLNEEVVNGSRQPCPPEFIMGVADSLSVDRYMVRHGVRPNTDMLSVSGYFTLADAIDKAYPMILTLGTQAFTIGGSQFINRNSRETCNRIDCVEGGLAMIQLDFARCKYRIVIRNMTIQDSGPLDFGLDVFGNPLESQSKLSVP